MKRWKVTIIETLSKEIEAQARNAEEAEDKVKSAYENEEIILYADDVQNVEFKTDIV